MPDASVCGPTCVVYDETLTGYDFGPEHPMNPVRVDLTMRLADELGFVVHRAQDATNEASDHGLPPACETGLPC